MIWQEKPGVIVMVTNLKEGNKSKCHQYWPETGSAMFGPFKVLITDSVVLADYCIRTLQVSVSWWGRRSGLHWQQGEWVPYWLVGGALVC